MNLNAVQVVGSRVINRVDVRSTESATTINREELARLPVAQDLSSVALLAPGVVGGNSSFGGISFGGSSVAENSVFINGLLLLCEKHILVFCIRGFYHSSCISLPYQFCIDKVVFYKNVGKHSSMAILLLAVKLKFHLF